VFHQRKNKLWETLSQVLFVESNHLNYPKNTFIIPYYDIDSVKRKYFCFC
jgi:hypothetical protein